MQRRLAQPAEILRRGAHRIGPAQHLLEMRTHHLAKLGEPHLLAFAVKQRPAQLRLELLDRAGQRRLGDIALLRRPREARRLAHRQDVTHLMDLHGRSYPMESCACAYRSITASRFRPAFPWPRIAEVDGNHGEFRWQRRSPARTCSRAAASRPRRTPRRSC